MSLSRSSIGAEAGLSGFVAVVVVVVALIVAQAWRCWRVLSVELEVGRVELTKTGTLQWKARISTAEQLQGS